jgi:hypothetical protein
MLVPGRRRVVCPIHRRAYRNLQEEGCEVLRCGRWENQAPGTLRHCRKFINVRRGGDDDDERRNRSDFHFFVAPFWPSTSLALEELFPLAPPSACLPASPRVVANSHFSNSVQRQFSGPGRFTLTALPTDHPTPTTHPPTLVYSPHVARFAHHCRSFYLQNVITYHHLISESRPSIASFHFANTHSD